MRVYKFDCPEPERNVEKAFDAGASLEDGVSGKVRIKTEYPNNCPPEDIHPRTTSPMPKPAIEEYEDVY